METFRTRESYDALARWWVDEMKGSNYGLGALERALQFVSSPGPVLDVGCGGEGRFARTLIERGYAFHGIDISPNMIELASASAPEGRFEIVDVCDYRPRIAFNLIVAWDSTFHLPLAAQQPVHEMLCEALSPGGIFLFTCGGGDEPGEISGEFGGQRFEYSTLGAPGYIRLLQRSRCSIVHLEYDQWPENHLVVIAKKL